MVDGADDPDDGMALEVAGEFGGLASNLVSAGKGHLEFALAAFRH